jgi:CHAT domain-containing protein/tetratricopeptide (TPR) repeat protein
MLTALLRAQTTRLDLGKTITSELKSGRSEQFTIVADAGQFLRVVVSRPAFATVIRLTEPGGKASALELHLPRTSEQREPLCWIANVTGEYRIDFTATEQITPANKYEITLDEVRPTAPGDQKQLEAQQLFENARGLDEQRQYQQSIIAWDRALFAVRDLHNRERESAALSSLALAYANLRQYEQSLAYYEQALAIHRQMKDRSGERATLINLGNTCWSLNQFEKAIGYYEQSLAIARETRDRGGERLALTNIGLSFAGLSQYDQAIAFYQQALAIARGTQDRGSERFVLNCLGLAHHSLSQDENAIGYYEQALAIARELKDRGGEQAVLNNLGNSYNVLSQYEKAIGYYEQALEIARQSRDNAGEESTLNNLSVAYARLSQYEKAIDYSERALAIAREIKDRGGERIALSHLGDAYNSISQYEKAIDYYQQSLAIARQSKNRRDERFALNNLGVTYESLSQYDKAIQYYEQSLAIAGEIKDRTIEAAALDNLGNAYNSLRQFEKAIGYYERALAIAREIKDRSGERFALNNLGVAYGNLKQNEKSIGYSEQALAIAREIKDRSGERAALDNLGMAYGRLRRYPEAIGYLGQSLAIARETKERDLEAEILSELMLVWGASGNSRLAIFYGKQAINITQSIRSGIRGLSRDLQLSYLKGNEKPYHTLAGLLIGQGRLAEAEQVLALLKEEEYFQYIRRDAVEASSLNGRADLTPEEAEYDKRYSEIGGRLMAIGAERGELLAKNKLTPEQMQHLVKLEQDLAAGNQALEHFLGEMSQHFSASAKPAMSGGVQNLRETQAIMEDLRELPAGTVAIFTLIGEDKFYAILRTPDAQKAYEYPIKAADLNRKVLEFRQVAQDPKRDPRPLAQELYKILMGGMAEDLRQAKAQTLMWSLDGALRYVPLAALYDGKQYLIEQYRVSVMTLASNARLKDAPSKQWTAAGFGATATLPSVSSELAGIISTRSGDGGTLSGEIKLDAQFTMPAMREELLKRHQVVHIASHFRFQAGDDAQSFLLLGDGDHLSMAELKKSANLFGGVQLLTLSACNTGMGDGNEVEGFGALAQRQGAKAVIASLWPVVDESTSLLMPEFYRIRESTPGITKLEALRQAQLKLLRGAVHPTVDSTANRSLVHEPASTEAPTFTRDPKAPYAHPYFWAPFFLMGNWL